VGTSGLWGEISLIFDPISSDRPPLFRLDGPGFEDCEPTKLVGRPSSLVGAPGSFVGAPSSFVRAPSSFVGGSRSMRIAFSSRLG
jgi:hypothetical protein